MSSTVPSNAPLSSSYVLDTHALVWRITRDSRLSRAAAAIFDAAERGEVTLLLSAIVVAELHYLNRKHRYFDFARTVGDLMDTPYVEVVPFTAEHAVEFDRDDAIPEMHDRIIAGIARRSQAPMLTRDASITRSGVVQVAW